MMDDAEPDGLAATGIIEQLLIQQVCHAIKKGGLREPRLGGVPSLLVADGLPDNVCWLFGLSLDGTGRIYSAKWS
jgi:hypothetical protein